MVPVLRVTVGGVILSLVPLTPLVTVSASPRTEPAPCTGTVCVGVENHPWSDDPVRIYRGANCTRYRLDLVPNSDTYDVTWASFRLIEGTDVAKVSWTDVHGNTGTYRFRRTKFNKGCKRTLQKDRMTYVIKTWDRQENK